MPRKRSGQPLLHSLDDLFVHPADRLMRFHLDHSLRLAFCDGKGGLLNAREEFLFLHLKSSFIDLGFRLLADIAAARSMHTARSVRDEKDRQVRLQIAAQSFM